MPLINSTSKKFLSARSKGLPPTYLISSTVNTLNEGESVSFSVATKNVRSGTTLYYTLDNISASDITTATSGSLLITDGYSGSVSVTTTTDGITEGTENLTFNLRTTSSSGPIVASKIIPILDTSNALLNIEYLIVAGGGGAGYDAAGGGGGGGLLTGTQTFTPSTAYSIRVGAGGPIYSNQGSNSVFASYTAIGGGAGGGKGGAGGNGGSGGGGGHKGGAGGSGTAGQGNNGYGTGDYCTGMGGGGAGAASNSRNGANGLQLTISGSAVYYAGGGGGGSHCGGNTGSSGGLGGGGNGGGGHSRSCVDVPTSGSANSGGGGGGQGTLGCPYASGSGGSGIVILKIPSIYTATFSAGVSKSLNTSVSGFKIYTVTGTSTASETVTFT